MTQNLYSILGVDKGASDDAVRQAYRKLARKYHPDVNPGDQKAEDRFKEVSAAYEVLSDASKRKAYDEFGEASLKGGFDPEQARAYKSWQRGRREGASSFRGGGAPPGQGVPFDLSDLFGFGGGGGGGGFRTGPARGRDVRAMVEMNLAEAIRGGEVSVSLAGKKPLTVRIPPGADNGSIIRLQGKGDPGREGGPPGDLILETRVRPHPVLRREGRDLHMKTPVTLDEAYNGGAIEIPTFDGPVKLRIPPRSQSGTRLRLRGKGIARGGTRGDLFVELDVRLPDKQDDALAEAIARSSSAYSESVRKEIQL